jgi:hypothetical protein
MRLLPLIVFLGGCQLTAGSSVVLVGGGADMAPFSETAGGADMALTRDMTPASDLAPSADLAPTKIGAVLLGSDTTNGATDSYVYPVFGDVTAANNCSHAVVGACTVDICTADDTGSPTPRYYGAGLITVTGGLRDVEAAAAADGSYAGVVDDTRPLWNGGETLRITAAGDAVPAYEVTLQAPPRIVVSKPVTSNGAVAIDRTADLLVEWSGAAKNVEISISADGDGTTYGGIDCIVPTESGRAAVASSLLSRLPAGSGTVVIQSVSQQNIVAGDWMIYVLAGSLAADVSGAGFRNAVTLQ